MANGIHHEIDAVAVLGIGGSYMGARALMEACCDPYHNELTRAERGSKPRMYFEGNNVDNDARNAFFIVFGVADMDRLSPRNVLPLSLSARVVERWRPRSRFGSFWPL